MSSFSSRMIAAARLDSRAYEEVETDSGATGQAMLVVLLSSLAAGFGSVGLAVPSVGVVVAGWIAALVGWVVLAALTYVIGTQLLPEPSTRADTGELLRTLGFAQSPGLARIVGAIPIIGPFALSLIAIWMLVAMVIAVRQALDYQSTARAVVVCLGGWVLSLVVYIFLVEAAEDWLHTLPQQALLLLS